MKIALVYPRISVRERYGADIGEIGGRQAPLGILSLSSFLKKQGHNVIVIDASAEELDDNDTIARIKRHSSGLVGISSTSVALRNSQALAAGIKASTSCRTIIGGPHISSSPEDFDEMTQFDFAAVGEGEKTMENLAKSMEAGANDLSSIAGLIWRRDGATVRNSPAEQIRNLDSLPFPDRDALPDIRLYRPPITCYLHEPVVSMVTSRGCPYKCIFCDKSVFGDNIRFHSAEYVLSEIEHVAKRHGAKEIAFLDDTFPCGRKRFESILDGMIKMGLHLKWSCMANANDLDENILPKMKDAGCWQIAIGVESGDDDILRRIRKKSTVSEIAKIAKAAHKCGIYAKGFFMLGHPGETLETIWKTRKFATSIPLTDVTCTIATPIKGSEFHKMAESGKYGTLRKNSTSSDLSYWEPVFIPCGLTPKILLEEQRKFFKSFYLRPSVLLRQIKKIRSVNTLARILRTIPKILNAENEVR